VPDILLSWIINTSVTLDMLEFFNKIREFVYKLSIKKYSDCFNNTDF